MAGLFLRRGSDAVVYKFKTGRDSSGGGAGGRYHWIDSSGAREAAVLRRYGDRVSHLMGDDAFVARLSFLLYFHARGMVLSSAQARPTAYPQAGGGQLLGPRWATS